MLVSTALLRICASNCEVRTPFVSYKMLCSQLSDTFTYSNVSAFFAMDGSLLDNFIFLIIFLS